MIFLNIGKLIIVLIMFLQISCGGNLSKKSSKVTENDDDNRLCPENYIFIAGNSSPGIETNDFCVAKFEMRPLNIENNTILLNSNNGGSPINFYLYKPSSVPYGIPWIRITQAQAISACESIGQTLMTNAMWQTIALDLLYNAQNWTGGEIGSGILYSGHSDDTISASGSCPDSRPYSYEDNKVLSACDGSDPYIGTGNSSSDPVGSGFEQARIHVTSNSEIIWDFAGNAREWVDVDGFGSTVDYVGPAISAAYELFSVEAISTFEGTYGAGDLLPIMFQPDTSLFSHINNNIGLFYISSNARSGMTISRGANFGAANGPGIFAGDIDTNNNYVSGSATFRCVTDPN